MHRLSTVQVSSISSGPDFETVTATELDSHADSPVVGKYAWILEDTGRRATVTGFTSELGKPMSVPVVNAAVAYDCEYSGETRILVLCNALYFKRMENNLIPPFMMRLARIEVDECPKFLSKSPTETNHSMYFPTEDIRIPFQLEGIISYVPTRCPTEAEIEDKKGEYLLLTPNSPTWDPHTTIYKDQEYNMTDYNGHVKQPSKRIKLDYEVASTLTTRHSDQNHFISSVQILDSVVSGVHSVHRKGRVNAATLSKRLQIPLEMAKRTLQSTTQMAVRTVNEPSLNRKFSTNDRMIRYTRLATDTFMDTFFASKKAGASQRGYTSCQVFATEFGHVFVVPMSGKSGVEVAQAIKRYFKEIGIPLHLICDQAAEQVKGSARLLCNEVGCLIVELEKGTPASNRAERAIKILKDGAWRDMFDANSPMAFWCYCIERRADIINATIRANHLLQGQTPYSKLTGQPTDISALCEYGWYEWVIYRVEGQKFPTQPRKLGRVLGPARNAGSAMSQWVLTAKGEVMPIQTLRALTPAEQNNPAMKERMTAYDNFIRSKFGDSANKAPPQPTDSYPEGDVDQGESPPDDVIHEDGEIYEGLYGEGTYSMPEADDISDYDVYIDAEVMLPKDGEHMQAARVIGQSRDKEGKTIGTFNQNPILNTKIYDVMFPDGSVSQYAANIIAENIYSQIDEDGYRYQLLESILDHRKDGRAIPKSEGYVVSKNGNKARKQTTKGWYFKVKWKDGTDSWVALKDLKESNPLQVAEYVQVAELIDEPAFAWWAELALKRRDKIIAGVASRSKKKTHKFGIEVPRDVRHALQLDKENNNTFWADAIRKEMSEVRVAFDIKERDSRIEPGREYLECYTVFDVKMDFTRKARFVANGSRTRDLTSSTYAGVVSKETVRIALTYAALNDLELFAADIKNAYLQAPITEKYWTRCGPEFGPELEGSVAYIVRALYGTKCGGRDFRNHLRECMDMLGYESCLADPDLWMREAVTDDGRRYYSMSTCCCTPMTA